MLSRLRALTAHADSWAPELRREVLAGLGHVVDGMTATRAAVLVAEQRSGAWQGSGDRSFASWHARTSGNGDRCATAQVRQAERLAVVPQVADAVVQGRIGLEHAEAIAGLAATGTPAQQEAVSSPSAQEQLIALAGEVDAGAFGGAVSRWAAAVDPDALEADHQAQRRERFLHVSDTPRGAFLRGRLDQAAGRRLRHALEALTPRPAADDDRDRGQRAADALDSMAQAILAAADTKPGAHVPPQVSLIMTQEAWVAARAHRDRQRAAASSAGAGSGAAADADADARSGAGAGSGAGVGSADATQVTQDAGAAPHPSSLCTPATWEDGTPVPASELAIALCECDVTRIAVDANGVPVDLGRTQRLFTGEQRRAIIARDRECIWPSCHQPARWCQIHHLRWWDRDSGPTSLDNGGLVCSFHHQEIHRRDLVVIRHVGSDTDPLGRTTERRRSTAGHRTTSASRAARCRHLRDP